MSSKRVLISGASGGLGMAIAQQLLSEGHFVVLLANKNSERLEKMITAFVRASEQNVKYTWAIGDKKTIDTYQIYLDNRCNRIIVSIYYGSRIIEES